MNTGSIARRNNMKKYIPATKPDLEEMLDEIGVGSIDDLFIDIPSEIRDRSKLKYFPSMSEIEIERDIRRLGGKNKSIDELICFRGAGAYDHHTMSVVDELIGRSEYYTSYTPYQPEISQGTLRGIYEFQTMIADLTGMEVANASMYDGATATAEAGIMAVAETRRKKLLVSTSIHPETRDVVKTYCKYRDIDIVELELDEGATSIEDLREKLDEKVAGVIVQSPNFFGVIEELEEIRGSIEDKKTKLIVNTDLISLGILKSPGEYGADIVVGDAQSMGIGIQYGGPYIGFMATKKKLVRKMPGRIVGESLDRNGKRCYVLTLQAREQHIRRYKATSNICSNHGLMALAVTIHMSLLGKKGLEEISNQILQKSHYLMRELIKSGKYKLKYKRPFFREFLVECKGDYLDINRSLKDCGILGGYPVECRYEELKNNILMCVTEKRSKGEIDRLIEVMSR